MADDFDFLEGNTPGLPNNNPTPKPVQRPVTKSVPVRPRVTPEIVEHVEPEHVEPEHVPDTEVTPIQLPEQTVLEHVSSEDIEVDEDDEDDELDVMTESEDVPKKKNSFKVPAWLVVAIVLGLSGAGWVVLSPLLQKIAKKPTSAPNISTSAPDISAVVGAGDMQKTPDAPDVASTLPIVAAVTQTPLPQATPILTTPEPSPFIAVATPEPSPFVATATPEPSPFVATATPEPLTPPAISEKIVFEGVTIPANNFTFEPVKEVSGNIIQIGFLRDGNKNIAVASLPQMDFDTLVRLLSDQALVAAKVMTSVATLSGPSRLGNASFPASIFSITQSTTGLDGTELKEVVTYLLIGGPSSNLLFATKTKSSEAGYGLSKFISLASELEYNR